MKAVRKLKQNSGFTISELLVATLILLLTSAMLVTCIRLGLKQLYKQTQESEAQILCTTLSTAVQDELSYASDVQKTDTPMGTVYTFSKENMLAPVGFYIATETTSDTDETTFEYSAVTDNTLYSESTLGKIYLASEDSEGNLSNIMGMVSTGAYNIENSSYGSLQAGMLLKETSGGFEVRISVYNGSDIDTPLSVKDFYVGKIAASATSITVDDSGDDETFTLRFNPNGGKFTEDDSTAVKTYSGLVRGIRFSIPVVESEGRTFEGWQPDVGDIVYSGTVTVSGDMTYTAQWSGAGSGTARFFKSASDYDPAKPGERTVATISVAYGNIIGGTFNDVTNYWPGHPTDNAYDGVASSVYKAGYVFDGWQDLATGKVYYFANGAHGDVWTCTKDTVFVAHYAKVYNAYFYRGYDAGGNPIDLYRTVQVQYNSTLTFPAAPTRNGHVFTGWEYERALDDKVLCDVSDTGLKYTFEKDMKFVATWDNYTLTFYNGNTVIGQAIYNQFDGSNTYLDTIEPDEFLHADDDTWQFNGWYSDPVNNIRDYDENGDPTPENTVLSRLSATNRNVDLYAGFVNKNSIYEKTNALTNGDKMVIIGGDGEGERRVMITSGDGITDSEITVYADDDTTYVKADDAQSHVWNVETGSNGRYRIYILDGSKKRYLDMLQIAWGYWIRLRDDANGRQWSYDDANHELSGKWNNNTRYVRFDGEDFENYSKSSDNGNLYIYSYKAAGEATSFNGYTP